MDSSLPKSSPYHLGRRMKDIILQIPLLLITLIRLPGFVRSIDYADKLTGDRIRIRVNRSYTIISVNHRDYWFRRSTGKFDGTGYSYCVPSAESLDCILGRTLE
jgi:hypothetical protein